MKKFPRVPMLALLAVVAACTLAIYRAYHAELDIRPSVFSECSGLATTAHVTWRVGVARHGPVSLYIRNVGQPAKLWSTGPRKGQIDTGPWMSDGTTILLMDAEKNVLAKRTMESSDCTGHS